jgi:hypothetical protein
VLSSVTLPFADHRDALQSALPLDKCAVIEIATPE